MSIYTRTSADIYFLNDKNIVSSFEQDAGNNINPIPSKELLISVYNILSGKNNDLCTYISSLDYENGISANGYILDQLTLTDGKINYSVRKIISSDVSGLTEYISDIINKLSIEDINNSSNGIIDKVTQTNGKVNISFKSILSDYIIGLPEYTESKINELDVLPIKKDNKLLFTVSLENGLISAEARNITSADFADNQIETSLVNNLDSQLTSLSVNWLNIDRDWDTTLSNSFKKNQTDPKDNSFRYDMNAHAIYLDVKGNTLSIDTTDFIKNRAITHVRVVDGKTMYIWFTLESKSGESWSIWDWNPGNAGCPAVEGVDYVKIDIKDLSQVYIFENGISSDKSLHVGIDRDKVPFFSDLTASDLFTGLPGKIISSLSEDNGKIKYGIRDLLSSDVSGLTNYVTNEINLSIQNITSNIDIPNGKISKIELNNGKISITSAWMTSSDFELKPGIEFNPIFPQIYIEGLTGDIDYLKSKLNTISINLDTVSSDLIPVQSYINQLSVKTYGEGIIYTLSNDVSSLFAAINHDVKCEGHFTKLDYHFAESTLSTLSGIIKHYTHPEDDTVKNGAFFNVTMENLSNVVTTNDALPISIYNGDIVFIHDHSGFGKISLANLKLWDGTSESTGNVYVFHADVNRREFEAEKQRRSEDDTLISTWLEDNFYTHDLSVHESLSTLEIKHDVSLSNDISVLSGAISLVENGITLIDSSAISQSLVINAGPEYAEVRLNDISSGFIRIKKNSAASTGEMVDDNVFINYDKINIIKLSSNGSTLISGNTTITYDKLLIENKISVDDDITLNENINVTDNVTSIDFRNTVSATVYANYISVDTISVFNGICLKSEKTDSWWKITIDDSVYGVPTFNFEKIKE